MVAVVLLLVEEEEEEEEEEKNVSLSDRHGQRDIGGGEFLLTGDIGEGDIVDPHTRAHTPLLSSTRPAMIGTQQGCGLR